MRLSVTFRNNGLVELSLQADSDAEKGLLGWLHRQQVTWKVHPTLDWQPAGTEQVTLYMQQEPKE